MEEYESQLEFPSDGEIAGRVRSLSGVGGDSGPDDERVVRTVKAVAETFEYWYSRVMKNAVNQYRKLIIARINPYVRRMQLGDESPNAVAEALLTDYDSRNFVTAGGWLLEAMAISIGTNTRKSLAEGVDLEREDGINLHLCILKSGTVTRNSDILKALKQNVRRAEMLHKQGKTGQGAIIGDYVQMTGCTSPTHTEDGIRRPSSAQFWSELTGLDPEGAIDLTLAIVAVAGQVASPDASEHAEAMTRLVAEYIRDPENPDQVDWEFLASRNMRERSVDWDWAAEDNDRDQRARTVVEATGYVIHGAKKAKAEQSQAGRVKSDG